MITNGAQFNNQTNPQQQVMRTPYGMPQQPQESIDGVALVHSDAEINNYPVAGGSTVALIDLDRKLAVFKTNDIFSGRGIVFDAYNLVPRENNQASQNAVPVQQAQPVDPSSELLTKVQQDIADLKKEYDDIYKMLEELTAPQGKEDK